MTDGVYQMDYASVNHKIAAFDRAHGYSIADDDWIIYADGAARMQDPMGNLVDPPTDPWSCAKRKLYYRTLILKRAIKAFDARASHYAQHAQACLSNSFCGPAPAAPEVVASELKKLQAAVQVARKEHNKATEECERAKPARLREMESTNAANRAVNEAVLATIKQFSV